MSICEAVTHCPVPEYQQLSSLALDICPAPSYSYAPNRLIHDMLVSPNSSLLLSERYADAQNSLSPSELSRFTRRLRTTFGREGRVTGGGAGVVALALAVLFNALAKEVKGQWVPESGPVPALFLQEPGRRHLAPVLLVSDYLRLVPNIANNPARMKEETERCLRKLVDLSQTQLQMEFEGFSEVDLFNSMFVFQISFGLQQLHRLLSNSTESFDLWYLARRLTRELLPSFNCDLEAGNTEFKKEVLNSTEIMEEFKRCTDFIPVQEFRDNSWNINWNTKVPFKKPTTGKDIPDIGFVFRSLSTYNEREVTTWAEEKLVASREDFDLKAKSHLPF